MKPKTKTDKVICLSGITAFLLMVAAFLSLTLSGCGGGGGNPAPPAPPTPNPIYSRRIAVQVVAQNDVTETSSAVVGAAVTITKSGLTLNGPTSVLEPATGTTPAVVGVVFNSVPEDSGYNVEVMNSNLVNQRFVTTNQALTVAGENATITVTVTPTFFANLSAINQADGTPVANANLFVRNSGGFWATQTATTDASGNATVELPAATGWSVGISNLNSTTEAPPSQKIGTDYHTRVNGVFADTFSIGGPTSINVFGIVPPCWSDTDTAHCDVPDPGDAHNVCINPGVGGTDPDYFAPDDGPQIGLDPATCSWVANIH